MLTGPNVILALKVAVAAVTIVFALSLIALWRGKHRLHGQINMVFFVLTVTALIALEVIVRLLEPSIFEYFERDPALSRALTIHLCFAMPAAAVMPVMLFTGKTHRRTAHIWLAVLFSILWIGTFVTGVFFLPHTALT